MQLLTPGALDWIHQVWNLGFYSRSLLSSPAGLFHIICHLFCKNPRRRAVPSCALVSLSLWRLLFDICIVLERSWKYTLCLKKVKRPPGFTAEGAVVVVVCLFSVSRLFFVLFFSCSNMYRHSDCTLQIEDNDFFTSYQVFQVLFSPQ